MKLLLACNGESEDDLTDSFGGWADFPLSNKGHAQAKELAGKIAQFNVDFNVILTSPLIRAMQTASSIADVTGKKMKIFEYIKERNTYGIMCGMRKKDAAKKYPWLIEAFNKKEYIDGQERLEDILKRAAKAYELIQKMGHKAAILVTHGNFIEAFFKQNFNRKVVKKEQASFILIDANGNKCDVIAYGGIEIE
jgi:2,3-bisphosphoglycerate-dependent phosphoglycerate mutase